MPANPPPHDQSGMLRRLGVLLLAFLASGVPVRAEEVQTPDAGSTPVDYGRDIAPLLKQHCGDCHGAAAQESNLRVDRRASLLRGGDSGEPAIVPGDPERGEFVRRITSRDEAEAMPPGGPRLNDTDLALLKRWIAEDARMPGAGTTGTDSLRTTDHWSFQPLRRITPPSPSPHWGVNPIDAFIHTRLSQNGLSPSAPADRVTLIRRLYLVMLGVPPRPEDVDAFVEDPRPDAARHLIDAVLSDPRYGERWARHWLDIVRFGETHGFETNRERPNAWRYRDYVIRALNEDASYAEFVREQVAGDALQAGVATGFLVAGPYDLVKSPDINLTLMQRQDELADMINTTGATFLGLTLGCARCHNHKFDPITQQDYYAIQAIFAGVQHGEHALPPTPQDTARLREVEQQLAALQESLSQRTAARDVPRLRPAVTATHNLEVFPPTSARFVRFTITATNSGSQPCLDELEIWTAERNVALKSLGAVATSSSNLPGYEIHQLEHVHDGRYGNRHSWISNEPGAGWVQIELPAVRQIERIEWSRDREGRYPDRVAVEYQIDVAIEPGRWTRLIDSTSRQPAESADADPIPDYDFSHLPEGERREAEQQREQLKRLYQERRVLQEPRMAYAGVFQQPGPTHRLYRGDPMAQREAVSPDTIARLGDLDLSADAREQVRRLRFADWLVADDNPLTARVIVNRLWQYHFGKGLVTTPSDFGGNGTPPSHPELLDWLATELIEADWSLKHIHRLILNSATFQQSHAPRKAALDRDADCRYLWRFPPRRLEAEAIRDSMLQISGVLNQRMGGPGFSAFEVQRENVRHYFPKTEFGPEEFRRMVYMTKVRQEQDGVFGVFDCPDAGQVMPRRSRSTTPLQALNLFNSRFSLQQAEHFASRLQQEHPQLDVQIERAFRLVFHRSPSERERHSSRALARDVGLTAVCRALLNSNEFLFIP